MPVITMLDIAKRRHSAKEVGLIEANLTAAPELKYFPARTIGGTSYKTLLRTGYPTAQFTGVNEGVQPSKSTYANRTASLLREQFRFKGRKLGLIAGVAE